MTKEYFKNINNKPYGENVKTLAEHAINSVTLCMDIPWKEVYRVLIAQSQLLGLMPNDIECINHMLQVLGFEKQPLKQELTTASLPSYMEQNFQNGEMAIVHALSDSFRRGIMTAVVPVSTEPIRYQCQGAREFSHSTIAIWIGKKENLDLALKHLRSQQNIAQQEQTRVSAFSSEGTGQEYPVPSRYKNHEYYQYFQPNPAGRNIGDCVIRAFSAVFDISWEEAMARLGDAVGYGDATVNGNLLFINLLIKEGFERHETIRRSNRLLTGKQFCERMNLTYTHGERIFAFVGQTHVAAVLPFKDEQGNTHYRIADSWDSSDKKINEYWVKIPETEENDCTPHKTVLETGAFVAHPRFGQGTILSITLKGSSEIVEIDFDTVGIKKLSRSWVETNCHFPGILSGKTD